jgi:hypothetical protein
MKLLITTLVGQRNTDYAQHFVDDLRSRLANRVQVTSDGHRLYLVAMDTVFGDEADYAMLQKIYGTDPVAEKRYSPAKCLGAVKRVVSGNPDADVKHISTSYAERQSHDAGAHPTVYSAHECVLKEAREPHGYSVALYQMFYNFVRIIHQTLKLTPAMAAGVTTSFGTSPTSLPWSRHGKPRTRKTVRCTKSLRTR